jgi:hypothetical protein
MKDRQHPLILQIVRFGLPLVVAVYYATAARGFSYTADPGYASVNWAALLLGQRFGLPGTQMFSLFWTALLALGGTLGLDLVLVAKILSLVFACFGILALYLLGVEILDDRILAFSLVLIAALDPLLLQSGPSGTPATCLLALSVASLFFARRRDFALASVFAGLATVLAWPAVMLMFAIGLEVLLLREDRPRAKTLVAALLVFLAIVSPWVLFAWRKGLPVICGSGVPGSALAIGWWTVIPAAICLVPALGGILAVWRSRLLRLVVGDPSGGLLLWVLWAFVVGVFLARDFWLAGAPVLLLGALQGLRALVADLREEYAGYSTAFAAVALMLVLNQVIFLTVGQANMARTIDAEGDLAPIVQWVGAQLPADITIESEAPGLVEYHLRSGQRVLPPRVGGRAEYVVSDERSIEGYREIFRPSQTGEGVLESAGGRFALFQRLESVR